MSFWSRLLMLAGEHPVWLCLLLPILFGLWLLPLSLLPVTWLPHGWTTWQASEQLSYFSTLWSVQATLAALAYPIVIAFVAVFLQRRPAADSFMHLYMLNSGALAAGLSSLMLVVVMACEYVAMPYFGAWVLMKWGILDSVWFALNAVLTTHFLYRTVEYLRPEVQSAIVTKYVTSVALPREIRRLYSYQVLAQAHSKGWITTPSYLDNEKEDGPKVLLARFGFGKGTEQGTITFRAPSRLVDVRLWPLCLAIDGWESAARKWTRPTDGPRRSRVQWPLLTVPLMPGTEYLESVDVAQVEDGPNLSRSQRVMLRWAYVFRSLRRERYEIRVKSVIEEFELDARTAAEKDDAKTFERAYNALVGLHVLLLGASLVETEDGSVGSWAIMPDVNEFFGRPMHESWNNAYRSVFIAAIETMDTDSSPIRRMCHIGQHLSGDALSHSPVDMREGVFDLQALLMYQLGDWWTKKIEGQGAQHGPHIAAMLGPPLYGIYEEVVLTFIGGWENARTRIAEIPELTATFHWIDVVSIARINAAHIQGTAKLLLAAVKRGDQTAAEWFADSLNKWWGNLEYEHLPLALYDKADFICLDDLAGHWPDVADALGLSEQDGQRMGDSVVGMQRGVLLAALRNFWTDIRLIAVELALSWASQLGRDVEGSLALDVAAGLLTGRQYRGGGTLSHSLNRLGPAEYLTAKTRQFGASGHYRGGYVARLSEFVQRVKDMQQPRMVTSRSYSSFGADDVESLQQEQLIVMAVLSPARWSMEASLRRQLDIWMGRQYDSIEIVRGRLASWLAAMEDPANVLTEMTTAMLRRTQKTHDAATALENLKESIESVRSTLESRRGEVLQDAPIEPDRLAELARFASLTAFEQQSGAFPLQLFQRLEYANQALDNFTLNMQQIRKGELTLIEMDQRAVNEAEFWSETMKNHVGALVLGDVIRKCNIREVAVADRESYYALLMSESERIQKGGSVPILILENPTRPDWVWQWQHADFGLGYEKPGDLRVWRAEDRGAGYVCNFNEIEVYSANLVAGQSMILSKDTFAKVLFQEYAEHQFVDVSCSPRSDSTLLVDVHLKISRAVDIGNDGAIRILYGADGGEE
ncbi:hypothetical protein [Burkholderia sp. Ac-20365]|uniref:hypothetical protein n=1 Tax=Burkholderia sp. Ac-20365 TaxID=2703897 RepID=UPI00197C9F33|nr:hypothetical protein [Burkholderia sp. Ac-20365]MBN3762013.1 hypothetical protein [Burkholderia sp. Ac-20365]